MDRLRTWKFLNALLAIVLPLTTGCQTGVSRWWYLGQENPEQEHYRQAALEIDYPDVVQETPQEVAGSAPPRTIVSEQRDEIWDLPLQEAIHTALTNNQIIRSAGQFLNPGNQLYTNSNGVNSVYDPAIQATGVLFGGVSVEAALADFDTNWTTALFFGRNETVQNSPFGGGVNGGVLEQDTANFRTALRKNFAYGAQMTLSHDVNYNATNSPVTLFPSVYTGNVQAEYRQQLLAGAGPEFVRVAGPLSDAFTSITGVSNGVLIARINQDISITNFEANIRDLVKDVEDTYWDLYLAYRTFDTAVTARNTALQTWRNAKLTIVAGGKQGVSMADEAQARDRYFETRSQAENQLGQLYTTEQRLRNLMGVEVNDRRIIRPADTPVAAKIHADWYHCLAEALTERVELRRQKWSIKSLELQLGAAKNFARPRLDFVARYRVNGFGDRLLGYNDADVLGGDLNNMYEKITQGDETGWDLGMELSMPIGLRLAKTQVRNIELRLTKARKVLATQELEISHELAVAFQELERSYATAISNFSRRKAAMDRFEIESIQIEEGAGSIDLNLRAQESLATAANSYHQSLVDYNKAIVNLYFRKGTLLREDGVHLVEGRWDPTAYKQAYAEAKARANAIPAPHLKTRPPAFAADGQIPSFGFTAPEAAGMGQPELAPQPDQLPLPLPTDSSSVPAASDAAPKELLLSPPAPPIGKQGSDAAGGAGKADSYFEKPSEPQLAPPVLNPGDGVQFIPPGPAPGVTTTRPSQNVPALWENTAPAVPNPPAPAASGRATVEPAAAPADSGGWQIRKEGWSLNSEPAEPFPITPVSGWTTETVPRQTTSDSAATKPAQQIGGSVPSYRK